MKMTKLSSPSVISHEGNQLSTEDEEMMSLLLDSREISHILANQVISKMIPPEIKMTVDLPDGDQVTYVMTCTRYGFIISSFDQDIINGPKVVEACNISDKDLSYDYNSLDSEMLRGFASLAIFNLQHQINTMIDAHEMLYSHAFTEFIRKCKAWYQYRKDCISDDYTAQSINSNN